MQVSKLKKEHLTMIRLIRLFSIAFLLLLFMGETNSIFADKYSEMEKIPRLSAQKAYALFQQKKIILFDTHPGENKTRASVVGAYYLDRTKVDRLKLKIPKNKLIGVY